MEGMKFETWQDLFEEMENDLERYPLPIEFDAQEELKQLNLRTDRLQELAKRFFIMRKRKAILKAFQEAPQPIKPSYIHVRYKD